MLVAKYNHHFRCSAQCTHFCAVPDSASMRVVSFYNKVLFRQTVLHLLRLRKARLRTNFKKRNLKNNPTVKTYSHKKTQIETWRGVYVGGNKRQGRGIGQLMIEGFVSVRISTQTTTRTSFPASNRCDLERSRALCWVPLRPQRMLSRRTICTSCRRFPRTARWPEWWPLACIWKEDSKLLKLNTPNANYR